MRSTEVSNGSTTPSSSRRVKAIGTLGTAVAAVALFGASRAYACTGLPIIQPTQHSVAAGSVAEISGSGFAVSSGASAVSVYWNALGGIPLVSEGPDTSGQFSALITVPRVAAGTYVLVAEQSVPGPNGSRIDNEPVRGAITVTVDKPATASPPLGSPAASGPAASTTPAPAASKIPVPTAAAPPARVTPAPAALVTPAAPVTQPGTGATQPAATQTAETAVLSTAPDTQPVPADLWSGLHADGSTSLLDAATPSQHGHNLPAGALLLGGSLVTLAGVALAAGRRRLVLSRPRR